MDELKRYYTIRSLLFDFKQCKNHYQLYAISITVRASEIDFLHIVQKCHVYNYTKWTSFIWLTFFYDK